ncbi:MAG: SLBB domain-containing protein [Acetobacteraceae bacterium]|nr:SLBB domain-containing protein [Acetobacteraceae bacterium]
MRTMMRLRRLRVLGLGALAFLAVATGQALAEGRLLAPSDVVSIKVVGQPDLDTTTRVELDGTVNFPYIGRVRAAGMSQDALARVVEQRLAARQIVTEPHVLVEVTTFGTEVSVQGAVGAPGVYTLDRPTTLTQLLARAGGLRDVAGSVILRRKGPHGPVELRYNGKDLLNGKINGDNILVRNNDQVYVELAPFYYIYGYVGHTGEFPLLRPLTVQQAIAIAGGLGPLGTESRMYVKRKAADGQTVEIPVSLDDEVEPNDTIIVNERIF